MSRPSGIGRALLAATWLLLRSTGGMGPGVLAPEGCRRPDSLPQPGVPEGKTVEFHAPDSKTFPGFTHDWWLYIPAQYNEAKPAALMIFQDGVEPHETRRRWRRRWFSTTSSRRRSCQ